MTIFPIRQVNVAENLRFAIALPPPPDDLVASMTGMVDRKIALMSKMWDQKLQEQVELLERTVDTRLSDLNTLLDSKIDTMFSDLNQHLDEGIESMFTAINQKIDRKIKCLDQRLHS